MFSGSSIYEWLKYTSYKDILSPLLADKKVHLHPVGCRCIKYYIFRFH